MKLKSLNTMNKKENFFENDTTALAANDSPIFIPSESYIEGYLKSSKPIKLECSFTGTIFTSEKLTIDASASMKGDVICENLILEGTMDGNIFCSGHVEFEEGSVFNGKIYTSTFKNLTQENSDFVVQIPNHKTLSEVKEIVRELNTDIGLTSDEILTQVRNLFYENVFSARKNPHDVIVNPFTEQLSKNINRSSKKPNFTSNQKENDSKKDQEKINTPAETKT